MPLPSGWKSASRQLESGQAWIYEVEHSDRPGRFALKRLKNPRRRDRFVREVATMQALIARGVTTIPPVVEADLEGERPYFVMPWYAEGSLEPHVIRRTYAGAVAGIDRLVQLAEAVSAVHAHGYAHRDLKPANALLDSDRVLAADFGLVLDVDADAERLTGPDEAVGSRLYVAPENESGLNDELDQHPADFYAFGKIAWALLAGQQPPARERHLEPTNRLDALLGEERFARLNPILTELANPDPRARLQDWETVIAELRIIRQQLAGEDPVPVERLSLDEALAAARRIERTTAVARALQDRTGDVVERGWFDRLVDTLRSGVMPVAADAVLELNAAMGEAYTLAFTSAGISGRELADLAGVSTPPGEPYAFDGTAQAPIFLSGHSSIGAPLVGFGGGIYLFRDGRNIYFWRIAFLRYEEPGADQETRVIPQRLLAESLAASGPHPAFLEQTLYEAHRFGVAAGEFFVRAATQHIRMLADEIDPIQGWS